MLNIHASCVAWQNQGILIFGPSGAGKSDLCLRLIAEHGAVLIADDRSEIELRGEKLLAAAPANIRGKLEVRGIGIADVPFVSDIPLALAVQIVPPDSEIERLPLPQRYKVAGGSLPLIKIHAFEASAPAKILLALKIGGTCGEKQQAC